MKPLSIKSVEPREGLVEIGDDNRAGHDTKKFNGGEFDSGKVGQGEVRKKGQNLFKSKNLSKFKKTVESDFLTSKARLTITKLNQVFIKALILYYFDLKSVLR